MNAKTELLFTAAEVAKFAGVPEISLQQYEGEGFGSPGHWRMQGGTVVYTVAGARLLALSMGIAGNEQGASALLVAIGKVGTAAQTPPPPVAVAHHKHGDWRTRADLQ